MKFGAYLKEKTSTLAATVFIIITVFLMGVAFKADKQYMLALAILILALATIDLALDYCKRNKFYKEFTETLDALDQKYLITDMDIRADFEEARIMLGALYETDKSMKEHITIQEQAVNEFKEYVESWIHEIKRPISALSLMNYNGNTDPKKQKAQIDRLENYVEQILFYARADAPEKDYMLKECKLESIVNKCIMEHKELLLGNKISIEKNNLNIGVRTDAKWLEFMLGQIVNNSIKYVDSEKQPKIRFYLDNNDISSEVLQRGEHHIESDVHTLVIEDNGIGISQNDLPRIFDKTFTGENGRKRAASTGMGLYICRKLCNKLGHIITAESVQGEYTRIKISFGTDKYYDL